jgi:membrane-bound ClpP family serine protease
MNQMFWTVVLLGVGLLVMVLEVFIPSGGILGFISVVAIIASVVMAFVEQGPAIGMLFLTAAVVAVPSFLMMAFRWFPRTPLGRRVLPPPPDASEVLPDSPLRKRARGTVGRRGRVVREMLPWGSVEIDGITLEAVSESGPLALGTIVEAVGVQGLGVVVRPVQESSDVTAFPAELDSSSATPASPSAGFSNTLEDFEFEGFSQEKS